MLRIEANVLRMKLLIEQYVQKHSAYDPELQDLDPLELEPDILLPECETNPIQELSLKERVSLLSYTAQGTSSTTRRSLICQIFTMTTATPFRSVAQQFIIRVYSFSVCHGCTSGNLSHVRHRGGRPTYSQLHYKARSRACCSRRRVWRYLRPGYPWIGARGPVKGAPGAIRAAECA